MVLLMRKSEGMESATDEERNEPRRQPQSTRASKQHRAQKRSDGRRAWWLWLRVDVGRGGVWKLQCKKYLALDPVLADMLL
jgi:hypothetical protein